MEKNATKMGNIVYDRLIGYPILIEIILILTLITVISLAYIGYTGIYLKSILMLSVTTLLILNFSMSSLLIGLRLSLLEMLENDKKLLALFIIMAVSLTIINVPVLMGDFNFNPNAIQQTILESCSVAGAVKIKNESDILKNKILDKRYFAQF